MRRVKRLKEAIARLERETGATEAQLEEEFEHGYAAGYSAGLSVGEYQCMQRLAFVYKRPRESS